LENISVISEASGMLILRPLIGLDKEEIINLAKEIRTFDVSILPHQDCCARFLPKHPETKADPEKVELEEKKLDVKKMVEKAVKGYKLLRISK
jgi:thiamine biosynthesis protein ThiI